MKLRDLFACAAMATIALAVVSIQPASAGAMTVLGSGPALTCYHAAQTPATAPADSIAVCTLALKYQSLNFADRVSTHINRGVLFAHQGNVEAAINDYNTSTHMNPACAEAYVDRGAAYLMQKRYKEALADLNRALSLGPRAPQIALYDRAVAHEQLGNIRAAYEDYRNAVILAPGFEPAIEQLRRFRVIHRSGTDGA